MTPTPGIEPGCPVKGQDFQSCAIPLRDVGLIEIHKNDDF